MITAILAILHTHIPFGIIKVVLKALYNYYPYMYQRLVMVQPLIPQAETSCGITTYTPSRDMAWYNHLYPSQRHVMVQPLIPLAQRHVMV